MKMVLVFVFLSQAVFSAAGNGSCNKPVLDTVIQEQGVPPHNLFRIRQSNDLAQIFLSVQRYTQIPLRLPDCLPLSDEHPELFAIVRSATTDGYRIQLAFSTECAETDRCHYGILIAKVVDNNTALEGKPVSLANGVTGYLMESNCGEKCNNSSLTWNEKRYQYTITLKDNTFETLKKTVESAMRP